MTNGESEEERVITLIDENGEEEDYEVIDIVEMEDAQYAVLLAVEENADEDSEGEVIILKFSKDDTGSDVLVTIEDDEEWERVADAWEEKLVDEAE
ncbi:MAG TPA: DUF1292 domain-containing protein [Desulfotomaculum sp.]|nr:MAG: hypothetical protein XD84_0860 [Desulfotomaculum sp. 46_80]HAG10693.1 DUF1292 domain-containing protein [Desulfotomaculum sp.]HBY04962.1 DUF1292 domain-containing protein [Desulfotomaculum sp.]